MANEWTIGTFEKDWATSKDYYVGVKSISLWLHNLLWAIVEIEDFGFSFRHRRNSSSKLFAYSAVIKHDFEGQINNYTRNRNFQIIGKKEMFAV